MATAEGTSFCEDWMMGILKEQFGFDSLLPVQKAVVPTVLRALASRLHLDICLSAPTGSGKTLCYLIPIIQEVVRAHAAGEGRQLRAVILVPSKSLGRQVHRITKKLCDSLPNIKVAAVCGENPQDEASSIAKAVTLSDGVHYLPLVDIVIATPQRLLKHLTHERGIHLGDLTMLVIDEADQVLGGSFTTFAGKVIAAHEATRRQGVVLHKMLCSATMTTHIAKVSEVSLRNPVYFTLDSEANRADGDAAVSSSAGGKHQFNMPNKLFEHWLTAAASERHAVLLKLVRHLTQTLATNDEMSNKAILVFCSTSETVRVMAQFLAAGGLTSIIEFAAAASEEERKRAMLEAFVGNKTSIVVATDALMRGIDLPGVGAVIMYDAPRSLQQYIHRTGRTARANQAGHAYSLLSKIGPSGTKDDAEVSVFKSFNAYLKRVNNVVHERTLQAVDKELLEEANELLAVAKQALKQSWTAPQTLPILNAKRRASAARAASEASSNTTERSAGKKRPREETDEVEAAANEEEE